MDLLIKGALVIDPKNRIHEHLDIGISHGVITAIQPHIDASAAPQVIDATGLVVAPGLVDMHVHLRDPGLTYKEDILSGCEAAAPHRQRGAYLLYLRPCKGCQSQGLPHSHHYQRDEGTGTQ